MGESKLRVLIAKPGLSPEGGNAPLPDLPPRLRGPSPRSKGARYD